MKEEGDLSNLPAKSTSINETHINTAGDTKPLGSDVTGSPNMNKKENYEIKTTLENVQYLIT